MSMRSSESASRGHQPHRVLVTGAAGRLGRVVLADLAARDVAAVGLDRVGLVDGAAERVLVGAAVGQRSGARHRAGAGGAAESLEGAS